jgi:hypothetical protein
VGDVARLLIVFGIVLAAVGVLLLLGARLPWFGRLPGDFLFRRGGLTIYVPIVTSILLSIVLTLLLNLFFRR